jgi:hypothetical protein
MNTTAPADKWFGANITIKYSSWNYSQLCESTLKIYWSVDNQPWTAVPHSGLDLEGQLLWMNVTRSSAKFAVFGTPLPTDGGHHGDQNVTKPNDLLTYAAVGAVVAGVGAGAAAFVVVRRKRKAPPEPTFEERVEYVPEATGAKKEAKPARPVEEEKVEAASGESVKVFRPAGGEVAIFRPGEGQKTKVFRPGERIFKPEAKEVEEGESAEGPVVEEEAVKPKVVEYSDEKPPEDEEEKEMPGTRSAEEEVEEAEGKKPVQKPAEKKEEDDLDDLLEDLK